MDVGTGERALPGLLADLGIAREVWLEFANPV
jgi:hypothetical protein